MEGEGLGGQHLPKNLIGHWASLWAVSTRDKATPEP